MAKKVDPFDKFREATLGGGNALGVGFTRDDDAYLVVASHVAVGRDDRVASR